MDRRAVTAHEPRLTSLSVGQGGLEISLEANALPAVLREANAHLRAGRHDQAKACLDSPAMQSVLQAMTSDSSRTDLLYVTAKLYLETEQFQEAMAWLQRISAVESHPIVLAELAGVAEKVAGYRSASLPYLRWAYELAPDSVEALDAYALCLRDVGRIRESIRLQEQALQQPEEHYLLLFELIWAMQYVAGYCRADLFSRAQQWAETAPNRHAPAATYRNEPSRGRRLRLGILSGDFKSNSPLGYFDPVLSHLDREAFELVAFSNVAQEDPGTRDYRGLFAGFEAIHGLPGHEVASRVRARDIDILIAFGGQGGNNRLDAVALKPAPIQVDWGGLCSMGLAHIDYRITDAVLDPPETQAYHREHLAYIPGGSICYQPPKFSPPVTPPPAGTNGYLTFGSFANHMKMNEETVALWSQVLRKVPQSRMLIKTPCAHDPGVRQTLLDRFAKKGVEPQRIRMSGQCSHYEHLQQLSQVDLLLDTYPFNSFRTTLEGLWMGVPTVTLSGETFVSRMGLAVMTQLGLPTLVADTPAGFVERACVFAGQGDELVALRRGLRPYLLDSSVCDPTHFARGMADLLRTMWRRWCDDQGALS